MGQWQREKTTAPARKKTLSDTTKWMEVTTYSKQDHNLQEGWGEKETGKILKYKDLMTEVHRT
jgi:hypothetical protein